MTDQPRDPFQFEEEPSPEIEPGGDGVSPPQRAASTGIAWGAILLLLGIALVVVFAVQNTDPVPIRFLWLEGDFSLAIVILVTLGVIVLLTELTGLAYRRNRRQRRAEKEELKRLRERG
jgi:uncharacterized integral membrane protein